MSDTTTSGSRPKLRLAAAIAAHKVMLPVWYVAAALPASSLGGVGGLALIGLVGAVWLWLLTVLVRWWREGRQPLWPYPLKWGLVLAFLWTLLFPRVRRAMAPKKVLHG